MGCGFHEAHGVTLTLTHIVTWWAVLDLNGRATQGHFSKLGNLIAFRSQITK